MTDLQASPMRYRAPREAFPKGWYCLAEAVDVDAALSPVRALGRDLVLYRTVDGRAQVADAYCPHLGAHLASHDGKVCGGVITCPFHKWRFDGQTGRVIGIPYTDVLPPASVSLNLFPTREVDGMVLAWIHPRPFRADRTRLRARL